MDHVYPITIIKKAVEDSPAIPGKFQEYRKEGKTGGSAEQKKGDGNDCLVGLGERYNDIYEKQNYSYDCPHYPTAGQSGVGGEHCSLGAIGTEDNPDQEINQV